MTRIKICGLKRPEDVAAVNAALPDYAGFVFAGEKRRISRETARKLKSLLDPRIASVGVFVNEPPENISAIVNDGTLDLVQLHGDEDRAYLERLRQLVDVPFIRAVRVQTGEQILEAEQLPCDYLLLDTFVKDTYGGSGKTFDLGLIPALSKPFFLAGGLHVDNVAAAIAAGHPWCVDISSGAETAGYKDPEKIRRLTEIVRIQA